MQQTEQKTEQAVIENVPKADRDLYKNNEEVFNNYYQSWKIGDIKKENVGESYDKIIDTYDFIHQT